MAESYEIDLEIQGGEQPEIVMEVESGATDGASARNAEAWAAGTRNGVPVGENDPAYHNNSKYYRDSAAAIAAGDVIDDDAGIGDYDLTWSADKLAGEFGGTQENMTAGNALFLLSNRGETDKEPYTFRKTGGSKNAYGREMLKKVVGGTVAWNQLSDRGESFSQTVNAEAQDNVWFTSGSNYISYISGHKYLFAYTQKNTLTSNTRNTLKVDDGTVHYQDTSANANLTAGRYYWIFAATASKANGTAGIWVHTPDVNVAYEKLQCYDLTQMFGSTIADAIYAMEQATAGSGVAWFKALFQKNYYAYDAGTLMSVNAASHALTGFNQWDEQWELGSISSAGQLVDATDRIRCKNAIRVIPGSTIYIKAPMAFNRACWYDDKMNLISSFSYVDRTYTVPDNARYMRFACTSSYGTTYNNDICINLSNTEKNGTYEPYQLRSYPLANVELRGIPKWENGQMVFDGDEYTPDGTVKRRYGIVDLGTLTWTKHPSYGSIFSTTISTMRSPATDAERKTGIFCAEYVSDTQISISVDMHDKTMLRYTGGLLFIEDTAYDDAASFKAALTSANAQLVYELATPTTESADPYRELQISNHNGTEKFIDRAEEAGTRDVAIPVGTETFYPVDVFALIDALQAQLGS